MEIFIEGSSDNTVIINSDSEFGGDLVEIGAVLLVAAFVGEDEQIATILNIFDEVVDLLLRELILGRGQDEEICFFDFIELDGILVQADLR